MKCKPILLRDAITLQEFIKDTICFGYPHLFQKTGPVEKDTFMVAPTVTVCNHV